MRKPTEADFTPQSGMRALCKIILSELNYHKRAIFYAYLFTVIAAASPLGTDEEGLSLVLVYPPALAAVFIHVRRSRSNGDTLLARLPLSMALLSLARLATLMVVLGGGLLIILAVTLFTSVLAPGPAYWLGFLYLLNLSLFAVGYMLIATDIKQCFSGRRYRLAMFLLVLITAVLVSLLIANRMVEIALRQWISAEAASAFNSALFSWPAQLTLLAVLASALFVAWALFTRRLNYTQ